MSSLREQLEAAMAGPTEEQAPTEQVSVGALEIAPVEGAEGAKEPVEGQEPAAAADGRVRGPDGKFAKAAETAEVAEIEAAKPPEPEAPEEPIRVPASLPAAVKAKFATLDPDVREAFEKLEDSVQTAKAEWGKKGERLNRFDEILSPRREKLQLAGLDEISAIQTLFAAQDLLERNPLEGLTYLARSYGVDLRQLLAPQLNQPQPGQQGYPQQQQPGFDPRQMQQPPQLDQYMQQALRPLVEQIGSLQQHLDQQRVSNEQLALDAAKAEIAEFSSKPENMYFENVRGAVQHFLQSGQAQTLQEAYDKATWADPQIRAILLKAQSPAPAPPAVDQQRQKAALAKAASGSIAGAPGAAVAPPENTSKGSLRADLEAAIASLE